ncbi:MAG: T9SS type A sorting domain-containing protein, partial [Bacteroidota bacterium]
MPRFALSLTFLVLLCLYTLPVRAQMFITGSVKDLLSSTKIAGAEIELKGQGISLQSNSFGDFVIELPNENPQRAQNLPFHFFHHLVLWEDGSTIQVQLSSLEGKIVSNIESNSGRYLLPNLDFGIYVLQIVHQGDRYAFKVFSDGIQTFFAEVAETQARYQKSPRQLSVDTLSIKAEGYYPRDIIIYPQDTVLRISMLRGDYEELHFLNELIDPLAYEILSSSPARSNVGG